MAEDTRQGLIDSLRDEHNVGVVAAQNVVDQDNPAWQALREIAKMREDAVKDTYMVLWLNKNTGKLGLVLTRDIDRMQLVEGEEEKEIRSPKVFSTLERAKAWCEVHANPDVVRHLIIKAIDDTVYPKKFDARQLLNEEDRNAFLVRLGFRRFDELSAWSDGAVQIPYEQADTLRTWGQLVKLMDLD